jgi:LCP family protein required for cell wall assembly
MKLFGGKHAEHTPPEPKTEPAAAPESDKETAAQESGAVDSDSPKEPAQKPGSLKERFLDFLSMFLNRGGWKKYRRPLIVAGCILLAVLVFIIAYSLWEKPPDTAPAPNVPETATPKPAVPEPVYTSPEPSAKPTPSAAASPTPEPLSRLDDCYTFVLLANDQVGVNTDTIIVGRLNTAEGTLDLVNIPRDTLVNVSWGVKKINTILLNERGDAEAFVAHLGRIVGFAVDCYAVVDIGVVEKLVDCIGGINYNVPRDMDYDDPTQGLHIHVRKGYQLLDGETAVKVLRYRADNDGRGYANGDLGRIAAQQSLLKALASQLITFGSIPNLDRLLTIVESGVRTDLSAGNISFFLREFLKLDQENVRFHLLPGTGVSIRGGSYYQLDVEGTVDMVNAALNPFNQPISIDSLDILLSRGSEGAISTAGDVVPLTSFFNFGSLTA